MTINIVFSIIFICWLMSGIIVVAAVNTAYESDAEYKGGFRSVFFIMSGPLGLGLIIGEILKNSLKNSSAS